MNPAICPRNDAIYYKHTLAVKRYGLLKDGSFIAAPIFRSFRTSKWLTPHRIHNGIPSEKRKISPRHQELLLCPHCHACRSSGHASAVEANKDSVGRRIKGNIAAALYKDIKVGVSLALIVVVTVLPGDPRHAPVPGLV